MAVYDALESVKSMEKIQKRILDSMLDSSSQTYKTLEKKLDEMKKTIKNVSSLSTLKDKLSVVRNWVQAGYDRSVLETDPEGVQFVGEGDLTFSIKMYKDAHEQLLNSDIDIHIIEGKVHVKVEGEWCPVSDIAKTIVFDPVEKKYTGWSYTHPTGFVFSDSMDWQELLPCAQLSGESLKAVQEQATLFWTNNRSLA